MAVKSDVSVAQEAVSKFWGMDLGAFKNSNFSLNQSNITSMVEGTKVANEMLGDLSKLATCIQEQATKFTDLANIIQARDAQDKIFF